MKNRSPLKLAAALTGLVLVSALAVSKSLAQAPAPPSQSAQSAPQSPPPAAQPAGGAQPDQVTLELSRNQQQRFKLAIPAFKGTGLAGESATAGGDLEATVRRDLELSGYFDIQGPAELAGLALVGDPVRDRDLYRSTGNEILLLGDLRAEGGKLVFEGRLFDLKSGQSILAKRYRGAYNVTRRIGHTFADEVIRYLTGASGIALSQIAYVSERGGFKEIYVMDYDGGAPQKVTAHRSTSLSPSWNPASLGLAYTSFVGGAPGIYFAELASGKKRPIVTSGSLNMTPSFSPDGSRVVFARSLSGNVEIFTSDIAGNDLRRLTQSQAIDTNPAWSPKGGEIVFTSSRAGNPHLYLMDAEGANVRRLTFEGTYSDGASWSPDGSQIVYTTRRDGRFQIAVTNVVTLETRVLTSGPGENESPTFSPDGRKIAYTSRRTGTKQIYVMDAADGANVRQLTTEGINDMADWSRAQ